MKKASMRFVFVLLFCAALFPVSNGCDKKTDYPCDDAIGCVSIPPGEPVKIGVIQDLSGSSSLAGNVQLRTVRLALEERNYRFLGHPVELRVEDEGCRPEGGKNAALSFVSQSKFVAIIGTTCSGAAAPASKILSDAGLVMISGQNSAPSLTATGRKKGGDMQPGYFRTAANDAFRVRAAAEFAAGNLGIKKAAVIDDGDTYTRGATEMFAEEFARLGGRVVLSVTIDKGETMMEPVLTSVVNSGAEFLFLPLFPPEALLLVRQVKKTASLGHLVLMGGAALPMDVFVRDVGADGTGMYFTAPALPVGPGLPDLLRKYEEKYGEPPLPGYSAVYDAVNMLFAAMETVAVQKSGALHIGRQALRGALYATEDFPGTTGRLTCNEFGDCGLTAAGIVRLTDPAAGVQGLMKNVVYVYEDK